MSISPQDTYRIAYMIVDLLRIPPAHKVILRNLLGFIPEDTLHKYFLIGLRIVSYIDNNDMSGLKTFLKWPEEGAINAFTKKPDRAGQQ